MKNAAMPPLRPPQNCASLSVPMDLGTGQPLQWVMRGCLLGVRLAERLGLGESDRREVYYLSRLRHIGCTATAPMEADLLADELRLGEGLITILKIWHSPARSHLYPPLGIPGQLDELG